MLAATAVLAAVAIAAAAVAVRAVRQLSRTVQPSPAEPAMPARRPAALTIRQAATPAVTRELAPRVVEGRLVVPPSEHQVVQAVLGRPGVRLSVYAHGLAHALRAESRDRISALMRREYRRRRRERMQASRRAVRAARPTPPAEEWLGS